MFTTWLILTFCISLSVKAELNVSPSTRSLASTLHKIIYFPLRFQKIILINHQWTYLLKSVLWKNSRDIFMEKVFFWSFKILLDFHPQWQKCIAGKFTFSEKKILLHCLLDSLNFCAFGHRYQNFRSHSTETNMEYKRFWKLPVRMQKRFWLKICGQKGTVSLPRASVIWMSYAIFDGLVHGTYGERILR